MDIQELRSGSIPVSEREEKSLGVLQLLLQITPRNAPLSLTGEDSVVLVSIDFEYFPYKEISSRINEIGISTFDTRDLSRPLSDLRELIHSEYHVYRTYKYSWRKFLFDESKRIVPDDMRKLLEDNIFLKDANGKTRRTVLVGHNLYGELDLIQSIGIDLVSRRSSSGFLGVLDTQDLGSAVIGGGPTGHHFSLENLLSKLDIPFAYLHIAGNDANFTLKALLMLAVRSAESAGTKLNPEQEKLLTQLRAIGHASIDAELAGRTPDEELHHKQMVAEEDEKRMWRLKVKDADILDYFPSFVELGIGD